jgi:hypothetical protein
MLVIAAVSRKLCELVSDVIADAAAEGHSIGSELARAPSWLLNLALNARPGHAWAAYLTTTHPHDVDELKLGKQMTAMLTEAEQLHAKLDRYAYGPPPIRFTEADVDQARAAGVLLELGRTPIILDRAVYRDSSRARSCAPSRSCAPGRHARPRRRPPPARIPQAVSARHARSSTSSIAPRPASTPLARTRSTSTSAPRCSTSSPPSTRATRTSRGSSSYADVRLCRLCGDADDERPAPERGSHPRGARAPRSRPGEEQERHAVMAETCFAANAGVRPAMPTTIAIRPERVGAVSVVA